MNYFICLLFLFSFALAKENNSPKLWHQIRRIGVDFFDDMLSDGG